MNSVMASWCYTYPGRPIVTEIMIGTNTETPQDSPGFWLTLNRRALIAKATFSRTEQSVKMLFKILMIGLNTWKVPKCFLKAYNSFLLFFELKIFTNNAYRISSKDTIHKFDVNAIRSNKTTILIVPWITEGNILLSVEWILLFCSLAIL